MSVVWTLVEAIQINFENNKTDSIVSLPRVSLQCIIILFFPPQLFCTNPLDMPVLLLYFIYKPRSTFFVCANFHSLLCKLQVAPVQLAVFWYTPLLPCKTGRHPCISRVFTDEVYSRLLKSVYVYLLI